ncbi:MAG: leucine-rich repeat protein [Clostridia bacterium]|nr:leucine-rich repeat protein [Clostridia bacterium]
MIVEEDNPYYESRNSNVIIEKKTNKVILSCINRVIPKSVKIIGEYAFSECLRLEKILFPSGIKGIEDFAFYNCCSLKEINFPNGLKKLYIFLNIHNKYFTII